MKDVTISKKEKENYILKYEIIDDTIVVTYANKKNKTFPYSQEFLEEIESNMLSQARNPKYLNNINKAIKINNLVMHSSGMISFLSAFTLSGFAISKNEIGTRISLISMSSGAVIDHICNRRGKMLEEKRENALKYKIYAKYLDRLNSTYNNGEVRDMTMNDADSFNLPTIKKLVKMTYRPR